MWPFKSFSGPRKGSPEWFGELLYKNVVENAVASYDLKKGKLKIPKHIKPLFFLKLRVYYEASVLRVLLFEPEENKMLLHEFEKKLFGTAWTLAAAGKLFALKAAMQSLDELFLEDTCKAPTWVRKWLQDIGYDETNAAVLVLFGALMGLHTKTIRNVISDLRTILAGEHDYAPSH
jgi:hypothetical protein